MTTKKKTEAPETTGIKERADELYKVMLADFGDKPLDDATDSMLRSYTLTTAQCDMLNEQILRDGTMIRTQKGVVEHPAVGTLHKLNADKARFYTPIKRELNKREKEAVGDTFASDDEFMGF